MNPLTPISPRTLRRCEVTALAMLYWPLQEVDNAVNIAELESSFFTAAHNERGEDSRGLWQINVLAHPHLLAHNLFDPQLNAYYASQIWRDAGSWKPWLNAAKKLRLL